MWVEFAIDICVTLFYPLFMDAEKIVLLIELDKDLQSGLDRLVYRLRCVNPHKHISRGTVARDLLEDAIKAEILAWEAGRRGF